MIDFYTNGNSSYIYFNAQYFATNGTDGMQMFVHLTHVKLSVPKKKSYTLSKGSLCLMIISVQLYTLIPVHGTASK